MILVLAFGAAACKRQVPVAASALPFELRPETTCITSPIQADGTPDYLAALNQRYGAGVTPENNGYLPLLKAFGTDVIKPEHRKAFLERIGSPEYTAEEPRWESYWEYRKRLNHGDAASIPYEEINEDDAAARELWTRQSRPHLADYLELHAPTLEALAQAVRLPHFWKPLIGSPYGVSLETAALTSQLRDMCHALGVRANLRLASGDFDGFLSDLLTLGRFTRQLGTSPLMLDRLVAMAIEKSMQSTFSIAACSGKLTASQCAAIRTAVAALGPLPSLRESWDVAERWLALQQIILVATGNLPAAPDFNIPDAWRSIDRSRVDWNAVLTLANAAFDADISTIQALNLRALNRQSEHASDEFLRIVGPTLGQVLNGNIPQPVQLDPVPGAPGLSREEYSRNVANSLLTFSISIGSYCVGEKQYRELALRDDLLAALLAVAELKDRTGAWPKRAEDMPTDVRAAFIADPYTADSSPIHYLLTPAGPRVFSVGPDGKTDITKESSGDSTDDISVGTRFR